MLVSESYRTAPDRLCKGFGAYDVQYNERVITGRDIHEHRKGRDSPLQKHRMKNYLFGKVYTILYYMKDIEVEISFQQKGSSLQSLGSGVVLFEKL